MAKIILLSGSFTFNSISYAFTNCNMNYSADVLDVTDQDSGSNKDFKAGILEGDFTLDIWREANQVLPVVGGAGFSFQLDAQNVRYSGSAICVAKSESIVIETAIKTQLTFKINGALSESYI